MQTRLKKTGPPRPTPGGEEGNPRSCPPGARPHLSPRGQVPGRRRRRFSGFPRARHSPRRCGSPPPLPRHSGFLRPGPPNKLTNLGWAGVESSAGFGGARPLDRSAAACARAGEERCGAARPAPRPGGAPPPLTLPRAGPHPPLLAPRGPRASRWADGPTRPRRAREPEAPRSRRPAHGPPHPGSPAAPHPHSRASADPTPGQAPRRRRPRPRSRPRPRRPPHLARAATRPRGAVRARSSSSAPAGPRRKSLLAPPLPQLLPPIGPYQGRGRR